MTSYPDPETKKCAPNSAPVRAAFTRRLAAGTLLALTAQLALDAPGQVEFHFTRGVKHPDTSTQCPAVWPLPRTVTAQFFAVADGEYRVQLTLGENLQDWWHSPLPNSEASRFVPVTPQRFLYAVQWINPAPEKPIREVTFRSADQLPIPALLAVTGHGKSP